MTSSLSTHPSSHLAPYLDLLEVAPLTALMRMTWTWDDRALRRDLADVLVDATAARAMGSTAKEASPRSQVLGEAAIDRAGQFVRSVLGSHLLTRDLEGASAFFALAQLPPTTQHKCDAAVVDEFVAAARPRIGPISPGPWSELARHAYEAGYQHETGSGHDLATLLARCALAAIGDDPAVKELEARIDGGDLATVAVAERLGTWDPALVRTRADLDETGRVRLTGSKRVVPYAAQAQMMLVMGRTIAGPTLYVIDPSDPEVIISTTRHDADTPFTNVELQGVRAQQLGPEGTGGRTMVQLLDAANLLLAGEQLGIAEASIEVLESTNRAQPALPGLIAGWSAGVALWERAHATRGDNGVASAMTHVAAGRAARASTAHLVVATNHSAAACRRRNRADALDLIFGGPAASHERLLERLDV